MKVSSIALWPGMIALAIAVTATSSANETASGTKVPSARYAKTDTNEAVSFRRHVLPLFSRTGCSGRECHGAFSGQGGFQLSLFGYDFAKDHAEMTADPDEIRVNRENPTQSLLLLKATMQEKHKGKLRFEKDSWEYNMVHKWIKDGATNDEKETGNFGRLEIFPKELVFRKTGETVQLKVLSHWADGTVEDVTELTRFRTNDESVADVSEKGTVTCKAPGDTHIVAFYDNGVQPVPAMLPVSDKTGRNFPKIAAPTKVDELIINKLRKVGIVPSELCTDLEFLRRVSLDMTGTLPSPDEVKAFQADSSPNKRAAKIEELLARDTYAAWWATKLNDFTGNNARFLNDRYFRNELSLQWYEWIKARVEKNTPYDKLVAGMVLATSREPGQSYMDFATEMSSYLKKKNPAEFADRETMPHYWSRNNIRKPEEKALSFAHAFLGVQIQCAQCHKHPFDQWTKQDFEQFQAFFDGIAYGSKRGESGDKMDYKALESKIYEETGYDRKDPKSRNKLQAEIRKRVGNGQPVPWQELYVQAPKSNSKGNKKTKRKNSGSSRVLTPKILGGDEVHLTEYPDPRAPLMEWMRDKNNPYFARAFVNRVWANYFGRGIVEPADDMNLANPPTNKELLEYLANGFVDNGYDMKWLHKTITTSDTYQRSWKANETNRLDEKNFSRMNLRRMPAEVVTDAIAIAVASRDRADQLVKDVSARAIGPRITGYRGGGKGASSNYALELFGKPVRVTNCDCERLSNPTLLQTLYTRNDPEMLSMIESGGRDSSWIASLRKEMAPPKPAKAGKSSMASLQQRLKQMENKKSRVERQIKANPDPGRKLRAQLAPLERQMEQTRKQIAALSAKSKPATPPATVDTAALIEEVFLRTVSRPPTASEVELAKKDIAAAPNPVDGVRDLLWAMLNTKEFIINH